MVIDEFLELSFRNHIRNNDSISDVFFSYIEPILDETKKYLSVDIVSELEEKFVDMAVKALYYAGVEGMKLAIGVVDGNIQQVIQ